MMNILLVFIIGTPLALIAVFLEIYPRLKNRLFGVDIWTHLLYLKEYHKQKGIPGKIENGFIISGHYDYPPAFIMILSRFPFRLVEKYEFIFSPFFDFVHLIFIFMFVYLITNSIVFALLTQLLYILTPIIIIENSSATPRSLGYMLFSAVVLSQFLFMSSGNYIFLGVAIILGACIFLSHRFTAQGFLFFSIFFTVLEKNIFFIAVFLTSFLIAVVMSRGFYLKVLKGHIGNLLFWKDVIKYRFYHQIKGSFEEYKTKDFVFKLYNQFLKFPPFVLAITNPWVLPVLYILFFSYPADIFIQRLVWWVIWSYILALFTIWIPSLRFLGEGQRYLELSAFPAAFLSVYLLMNGQFGNFTWLATIIYILVGISALVTVFVIQYKAIIKDTMRTLTPSMKQMFAYLLSLEKKPRLLCIPHQITTSTIYHTGCPVFVNADYSHINKIKDVYPFIKKPIKDIMRTHKLDMILLNESYASIEDLKIEEYRVIKKIDNFVLIEV
ncbi:MAG: hypothetical protein EXS44_02405 [Candidatus Levybacteria bacterium]|nr:hypothetical protein [Candidatus Levybacteria bacterium]